VVGMKMMLAAIFRRIRKLYNPGPLCPTCCFEIGTNMDCEACHIARERDEERTIEWARKIV